MSAAAKRAHKDWTTEVIARAWTCEIQRFHGHRCDGPVDGCHIINKRFLRDTFGSGDDALPIVFDLRNGLAGCRVGHSWLDGPTCDVTFERLPSGVVEFAREHGILWRLERMYPRELSEAA